MIVPDAKDWTWVLQRPCPECGFDASATAPTAVAELVRSNARAWQQLFGRRRIVPGRPDASTWSSLEYACHVRDVDGRYLARIELMVAEDDPLFPNWDQDASATDDAYERQDPAVVIEELVDNADALAARLDALGDSQWERPGRRSDGASFTVASIVRYMVHDTIHHVWDVERAAG